MQKRLEEIMNDYGIVCPHGLLVYAGERPSKWQVVQVKPGDKVIVQEWHARPNRGANVYANIQGVCVRNESDYSKDGHGIRRDYEFILAAGSMVCVRGYGTSGWVDGDFWRPEKNVLYYCED